MARRSMGLQFAIHFHTRHTDRAHRLAKGRAAELDKVRSDFQRPTRKRAAEIGGRRMPASILAVQSAVRQIARRTRGPIESLAQEPPFGVKLLL